MKPSDQALKAARELDNEGFQQFGDGIPTKKQLESSILHAATIIDQSTNLPTLTAQAAMAAELAEAATGLMFAQHNYRTAINRFGGAGDFKGMLDKKVKEMGDTLTRWQAMQKEGGV